MKSGQAHTHNWSFRIHTFWHIVICQKLSANTSRENKLAKDRTVVKTVMTDVPDSRPVEDILWTDEHYLNLFSSAALELEAKYLPLGKAEDGIEWKSETLIAPWVIYVLQKNL
jgi:hypothetical protein